MDWRDEYPSGSFKNFFGVLKSLAAILVVGLIPTILRAGIGRDNLYACPVGLEGIFVALGAPFGAWAGYWLWKRRRQQLKPNPLPFETWPVVLRVPLQAVVMLLMLAVLAAIPGVFLRFIYVDIVDATARQPWTALVEVQSYDGISSRRSHCARRLHTRDKNGYEASLCIEQKIYTALDNGATYYRSGERVLLIGRRNILGTVVDAVQKASSATQF